jgi:hypothetical protein
MLLSTPNFPNLFKFFNASEFLVSFSAMIFSIIYY